MEQLWTPWRIEYIRSDEKQPGCIFCLKPTQDDAQEHIVVRGTHAYVTLNRYPYNNGHVLVIPYRHVASQEDLQHDELIEITIITNQMLHAIRQTYQPQGFNIGANIGKAAGAGIDEHYHFHIVPRWSGDGNYMTAIAQTRMIPQMLDQTHQQFRDAWQELYGSSE